MEGPPPDTEKVPVEDDDGSVLESKAQVASGFAKLPLEILRAIINAVDDIDESEADLSDDEEEEDDADELWPDSDRRVWLPTNLELLSRVNKSFYDLCRATLWKVKFGLDTFGYQCLTVSSQCLACRL